MDACGWETILFVSPHELVQNIRSPGIENILTELEIVRKTGWTPKVGMAPTERSNAHIERRRKMFHEFGVYASG